MEESKENNVNEDLEGQQTLGHLDRMIGVISEPSAAFSAISKQGTRHTDWLIPILLMIIVTVITTITAFSNPEIKAKMMQMQRKTMEEQFEKQIASGQMTREEADKIKENASRFTENPVMLIVFPAISTVIVTFIWFFFFALIGWLIAKNLLGGTGTFNDAMTALGLPLYITVISLIIIIIISFASGELASGVNLLLLTKAEVTTFSGFIQSKIDVFAIWFYAVVGIGFARMFKSDNTLKYVITSLSIWFVLNLAVYFLATTVPLFRGFLR